MAFVIDGSVGNKYPTWTTAGRPTSPAKGLVGFNTSYGAMEWYNGTTWKFLSSI